MPAGIEHSRPASYEMWVPSSSRNLSGMVMLLSSPANFLQDRIVTTLS